MNIAKRILIIIYSILFFIPIVIITTIICGTATIIMIPIFGDNKWGYYPGKVWARIICYASFVRINTKGNENLEHNKSYIFLANHQSIFDIFLIYGWLNSKFKWVMKKEIRNIPLVGKACDIMGHIFINRSSAIQAQKSLLLAEAKLKNGNSIVIFPEGTRTKDGKLGKFKKGAFHIARDLHLPIVPITIKGAFEVMPYNTFIINPGKIEMIIHEPINTDTLTDNNIIEMIENVKNIINKDL